MNCLRLIPVVAAATLAGSPTLAQVYVSAYVPATSYFVPAPQKPKPKPKPFDPLKPLPLPNLTIDTTPQGEFRDIPCPEIWRREALADQFVKDTKQNAQDRDTAASVGNTTLKAKYEEALRALERRASTNTLVLSVLRRQLLRDEVRLTPKNGAALFILGQSHLAHLDSSPIVSIRGVELASFVPVFTRNDQGVRVPITSLFAKASGPMASIDAKQVPDEFIDLMTWTRETTGCIDSHYYIGYLKKPACGVANRASAEVALTAGTYCSASAIDDRAVLAFTMRYESKDLGPDAFVVTYRLGYAPEPLKGTEQDRKRKLVRNNSIDRHLAKFLRDSLGSRQSFRVDGDVLLQRLHDASQLEAAREALGQVADAMEAASPAVTDKVLNAYFLAENDRYLDGPNGEVTFVIASGATMAKLSFARVNTTVTIESIELNNTKLFPK